MDDKQTFDLDETAFSEALSAYEHSENAATAFARHKLGLRFAIQAYIRATWSSNVHEAQEYVALNAKPASDVVDELIRERQPTP